VGQYEGRKKASSRTDIKTIDFGSKEDYPRGEGDFLAFHYVFPGSSREGGGFEGKGRQGRRRHGLGMSLSGKRARSCPRDSGSPGQVGKGDGKD